MRSTQFECRRQRVGLWHERNDDQPASARPAVRLKVASPANVDVLNPRIPSTEPGYSRRP